MYLLKLRQKNISDFSLLCTTKLFQTLHSLKKILWFNKAFMKG